MSATEIIEQVRKLPRTEVFELAAFMREYEASLWDQQIETDLRDGNLDALGREALAELRAGRTRPFPE